jgi:hypothetical protein
MYAKFQAGIWEALAKRYPDVDIALVRRCVARRCCLVVSSMHPPPTPLRTPVPF